MKIPFNKTTLGEEEKQAISKVIDSGWVVQGPVTAQFEEEFSKYVGSKYAVFVDSGTSALFLSLKYYSPKGKIEVPSITFCSTAEVVVNAGLEPYFVDINPATLCFDKTPIGFSIPVHLTGVRAYPDAPMYDSAHRIERGDVSNSTALWCYSFYATKNMTTINGGMIATNSKTVYEWLIKARDHGISHGTMERYKEGKWRYSVDFVGYRVKADDVRAAIGLVQLKKLDEMNEKRNAIVKRYNEAFHQDRTGNHLYPLIVENRDEFIVKMRESGIQCSVHFLPLHKMPAYERYARESSMSCSDYIGDHLVSLPLYPDMTVNEVEYVISTAKEIMR